jgi:hypothetical protein
MGLVKEECGHPLEWNLRVVMNSQKYTYCIGCMVEMLGLENLEAYDNPYIKLGKPSTKKKAKVNTVKAAKAE